MMRLVFPVLIVSLLAFAVTRSLAMQNAPSNLVVSEGDQDDQ